MPNRILRDGINSSEIVNALSEQGELFYRKLMSVVDDYGRWNADPRLIRAAAFPLRLEAWPIERIQACLDECEVVGLVLSYEVKEKRFIEIQNFNQRVRENVPSKFPPRPILARLSAAQSGGEPPKAARATTPAPPSPSATHQGESEGDCWTTCGFESGEAAETWWADLVKKHPNRHGNAVAHGLWRDMLLHGQFIRLDFENWYRKQIPIWRQWTRRGVQARNLGDIFRDREWMFPPAEMPADQRTPAPEGPPDPEVEHLHQIATDTGRDFNEVMDEFIDWRASHKKEPPQNFKGTQGAMSA